MIFVSKVNTCFRMLNLWPDVHLLLCYFYKTVVNGGGLLGMAHKTDRTVCFFTKTNNWVLLSTLVGQQSQISDLMK